MPYRVVLTEEAERLLTKVRDTRELKLLVARIEKLADNPEQQGKALRGDLVEYRSIRAVGQRYRIIYRVEEKAVLVIVTALSRRKEGDRKDVYQLAQKLIQAFQIEQFIDETDEEDK